MPKARLRYAIAIDSSDYAAGSQDPVIFVFGSEGGAVRPFLVRRGWSGPQGSYVEQFRIVENDTRLTRYRSHKRVVELTGEYYTDDFEDTVEGVSLRAGEYQLVFTIDGGVVPAIPVFVEPGPGAIGGPPAVVPSIIDEAVKKSDLVWLAVEGLVGQSHRPVWFLWHNGAAYVVHGGSEQQVPGLDVADTAVVTVRSKDKGGRLVSWRAAVDDVPPGTPVWDEVVPTLVGKRLNNKDGDAAAARWARECKVSRLMPTGELVDDPANPPRSSFSAPPAPTDAATETHIPVNFNNSRKGFLGSLYGAKRPARKTKSESKST